MSSEDEPPSFATQPEIDRFIKHLHTSKRILCLCGAGLSAPSGIPTFAKSGALWKGHRAADLSNIVTFEVNPGLVWKYYADRRRVSARAVPNKAHFALAKVARKKGGMRVVMQNIDGLSQRAKHPKERLYEFHGSLFNFKCSSKECDYIEKDNFEEPLCPALARDEDEIENFSEKLGSLALKDTTRSDSTKVKATANPEHKENSLASWLEGISGPTITDEMRKEVIPEADLPHCPKCSSLLRPDIVWFGEPVKESMYEEIVAWIKSERKLDLMMVIGTRAGVRPAQNFVQFAMEQGAKVAWVNLDKEHRGGYDIRPGKDWLFIGDVEEVLEVLFEGVLVN